MSFQMVPLRDENQYKQTDCFGTMSFQMVPLQSGVNLQKISTFWNYVIPDGSTTLG